MERIDALDGHQWLHTALLAAITQHLLQSPGFATEVAKQVQTVQAHLEAESRSEGTLQAFLDAKQSLGL